MECGAGRMAQTDRGINYSEQWKEERRFNSDVRRLVSDNGDVLLATVQS